MLIKPVNFSITAEQLQVVDLIIVTESTIRNNKLAKAEQLRLQITAALAIAKKPCFNLTSKPHHPLANLFLG